MKASQNKDINTLELLEAELVVRLNPEDKEDQLLLTSLNNISGDWSAVKVQEFCDRTSYLLKHDWERAKQEATTKISCPSLMCAATIATALLTLIGILNGMWTYFLFSGAIFTLVLLIPTLIEYFIIKRNEKSKDKRKPILYLCNHKERYEYKTRSERNQC
ncbi:hypothetical protein [Aeromonas veronii]|uniref:hypothetical protein n=1 Tax=Aeromonas veronii TaxID=654 RepID=UPI0032ECB9B8